MQSSGFHAWCDTTLGGIGLFCGVDTETLLRLGERAHWQDLAAGQILVRRGDVRRTFFALVRGTIHVRDDARGVTETSNDGAVVGFRMSLRHRPATIHAVVASPARVAEIARADLFDGMTACPTLAHNVARLLDGRGDASEPRELLDARIAAALIRAVGSGSAQLVPVAVDPVVWGTLLGIDAIDIERALRRLEREGLIHLRPPRRVLVDPTRLRRRLA